jgi:Na+/H+ antiporter NhaD/arsenite permease-like protein
VAAQRAHDVHHRYGYHNSVAHALAVLLYRTIVDEYLLFVCHAAAAGVSAFLDNVTTMLLMGPITISMMKTANGRDPRPLLMAQVRHLLF